MKINLQGEIVDRGSTNLGVNQAGFTLHSAIYAARPDIKCIVHIHTPAGAAVRAGHSSHVNPFQLIHIKFKVMGCKKICDQLKMFTCLYFEYLIFYWIKHKSFKFQGSRLQPFFLLVHTSVFNSRWHFCCIWETSRSKWNKSVTKSHDSFELNVYQLGPRLKNKLWTALLGNHSWFHDTVNACTALQDPVRSVRLNSAQKSVMNRSNGTENQNL